MKIYIASSWKNQHAVEMLTALLREKEHEVRSFVEIETNCHYQDLPFEQWVKTPDADTCFSYDSNAAMTSDLVIYISPSGKDAAAELGMAYAKGIPIIGLHAKGEDFGLMRKMMYAWVDDYRDVLFQVDHYQIIKNAELQL